MYINSIYAWYAIFLFIGMLIGVTLTTLLMLNWKGIIKWFIKLSIEVKEELKKNENKV